MTLLPEQVDRLSQVEILDSKAKGAELTDGPTVTSRSLCKVIQDTLEMDKNIPLSHELRSE